MEFFGINGAEFLVLGLLAVVILGPDKLPEYARKLAGFIRGMRNYATDAREKIRGEMGDEVADMDWRRMDPRRYDPRKIIRDALFEDDQEHEAQNSESDDPSAALPAWAAQPMPNVAEQEQLPTDEPAPFDDEAT